LSNRDGRKQATRTRVLSAASELFDEVGFDAATIRAIARRATVSVGSVFTTFSGKTEIFHHVMEARLDALYAELERIIPHLRGSTADRLRSIMAVHYGFETRRIRLFVAYIAAMFGAAATGQTPPGRNPRLRAMLTDVLREGQARGEVRPDADLDLFVDTMVAAYFWNYREAAFDGDDAARMTALMDRQIGLLFDGVAAGGA
jgi:AcrR family transcriptional regulator